jgi:hypothetical protein
MSYQYDRKQTTPVLQGSRPLSHRAGAVEGILALAVLVASCHPVSALDCAAAKSETGYWSWRMVDGKRCWYPGRGKIDKAQLRWGTAGPSESVVPVSVPEDFPPARPPSEATSGPPC